MFVVDFTGPYTGPDYASDSSDSDSSRSDSRSPSPSYDITMRDENVAREFTSSLRPLSSFSLINPDVDVSISTPSSPRPSSSSSLRSVSPTAPTADFGHNIIAANVWADEFLDIYLRMPRLQCLFLLGVKPPADRTEDPQNAVCGAGLGWRQVVEEVVDESGGRRLSFVASKMTREGWWWEDMGRSGIFYM